MIIIYANCQGEIIKKFLKPFFNKIEIYNIFNYLDYNYLDNKIDFSQCNLFIYQNNGNNLELILNKLPKECKKISIPYVFNDGIASLSHAPQSKKWPYGKIYGDEIIINLINNNYSKEEIIDMFLNNQIDFDLENRIKNSFNKLLKREQNIDIKIYDFIKDNYKSKKLFLTHNHPTTVIFKHIIKQILNILNKPYKITIDNVINEEIENPGFDIPCYVLTPYDIQNLELLYNYNDEWKKDGIKLINIIYNFHKKN